MDKTNARFPFKRVAFLILMLVIACGIALTQMDVSIARAATTAVPADSISPIPLPFDPASAAAIVEHPEWAGVVAWAKAFTLLVELLAIGVILRNMWILVFRGTGKGGHQDPQKEATPDRGASPQGSRVTRAAGGAPPQLVY